MAVHKCKKCIWSNKINERQLFCIFPRCIIKIEISKKDAFKEKSVAEKARTTCDVKKRKSRNN